MGVIRSPGWAVVTPGQPPLAYRAGLVSFS